MAEDSRPLILLTGATGYIGGRLRKAMETAGLRVRCMARRPEFLRSRVAPSTEVCGGDCLQPLSLAAAMQGVDMDPSPTSQHYVPPPLDKDMMDTGATLYHVPPPRHPGRVSPADHGATTLAPLRETPESMSLLPSVLRDKQTDFNFSFIPAYLTHNSEE